MALSGQPKRRYDVGAVDLSLGVDEVARERAEAQFSAWQEQAERGSFLQRTWNSVVTQNLFREVYRQRALARARTEIMGERSLYGGGDEGRAKQRAAEEALVTYALRASASDLEKEQEFVEQVTEGPQVKVLVMNAAEYEEVTRESFDVSVQEALRNLYAARGKRVPELLASNAWEVVEALRTERRHNRGLDLTQIDIRLTMSRLRHGVRTEQERTEVDRLVDKLKGRTGLASALVNETTAGVAISAAMSTLSLVGRSMASKAAFMVGGLMGSSAASAAVAHYKEGRRLDRERWLHARQVAAGEHEETLEPTAVAEMRSERIHELEQERNALKPWNILRRREIDQELATLAKTSTTEKREALQETLVESVSVQESLRFLEETLRYSDEQWRNEMLRNQVRNALVDLDARASASLVQRRDFLRYSSEQTVAEQRTALLIVRSKVRERLAQASESQAVWQRQFTADVVQRRNALAAQVEQTDERYGSYRKTMQALAAKKAALSGVLVGAAVQTVAGALSERITSPLEALAAYVRGWWSGSAAPAPEVTEQLTAFAEQANTTLQTCPGDVPNIPLEHPLPPVPPITHVVRDAYFINEQPSLIDKMGQVIGGSDGNELKLAWGGEHGLITLPNGERGYVLDISQMKNQESWNGGFLTPNGEKIYTLPNTVSEEYRERLQRLGSEKVAVATAIQSKRAVMLLVPEGGAREQAIVIPVGSDGRAIIPNSSPAAQLFTVKGGKAVFTGFRVEAALVTGEDESAKHVGVLAAFKGTGTWHAPHAELLTSEVPHTEYPTSSVPLATKGPAPEGAPDMPWTVPVTGRRGMRPPERAVRVQADEDERDIAPPQLTPDMEEELARREARATEDRASLARVVAPPLATFLPPGPPHESVQGPLQHSGAPRLARRRFTAMRDKILPIDDGSDIPSGELHAMAQKELRRLTAAAAPSDQPKSPEWRKAMHVQGAQSATRFAEQTAEEGQLIYPEAHLATRQIPRTPDIIDGEYEVVTPEGEKEIATFRELASKREEEVSLDDLYQAVFGHSRAEHVFDNADRDAEQIKPFVQAVEEEGSLQPHLDRLFNDLKSAYYPPEQRAQRLEILDLAQQIESAIPDVFADSQEMTPERCGQLEAAIKALGFTEDRQLKAVVAKAEREIRSRRRAGSTIVRAKTVVRVLNAYLRQNFALREQRRKELNDIRAFREQNPASIEMANFGSLFDDEEVVEGKIEYTDQRFQTLIHPPTKILLKASAETWKDEELPWKGEERGAFSACYARGQAILSGYVNAYFPEARDEWSVNERTLVQQVWNLIRLTDQPKDGEEGATQDEVDAAVKKLIRMHRHMGGELRAEDLVARVRQLPAANKVTGRLWQRIYDLVAYELGKSGNVE